MIEPWEQAKLDQAMAELNDVLPSLWRSLYDGCRREGFTRDQAMALVIAFICSGTVTGGGNVDP